MLDTAGRRRRRRKKLSDLSLEGVCYDSCLRLAPLLCTEVVENSLGDRAFIALINGTSATLLFVFLSSSRVGCAASCGMVNSSKLLKVFGSYKAIVHSSNTAM